MARYNEQGQQVPDQTPLEMPLNCTKPEPLENMMARLIRTELAMQSVLDADESDEEAGDFDVDDWEDEETILSGHQILTMKREREDYDARTGQETDRFEQPAKLSEDETEGTDEPEANPTPGHSGFSEQEPVAQ